MTNDLTGKAVVPNPAGTGLDGQLADAPHAVFMAQRRFGALDGLRALSIAAVIWHHTAPDGWGSFFAHVGAHGVSLFFAISGFLITTLLLREQQRNGRIDLKAFYLRRSLRIFPLYYAVLLLYVVVVVLFERDAGARQAFFDNLPYFLTYTSNIFVPLDDGRVIFYFVWSLAAEEQFYLVWPALLILCAVPGRALLVLCTLIVLCAIGQMAGEAWVYLLPVAILAGASLAIVMNSPRGFRLLWPWLGHKLAPAVLLIAFAMAVSYPATHLFVLHLLCAGLVGACVIREDHLLAWPLSLRPVVYVGTISYGMYLLHMLAKNAAGRLLGMAGYESAGVEVFLLTCLISTVAAGLSFKYYEAAFLRLKVRYER
jgi:peptidoglycan/LPS O-acetylase OafA/YrhL